MDLGFSNWAALAVFALAILYASLFMLTVAVHFPRSSKGKETLGTSGEAMLWLSILIAATVAALTISLFYANLPWYIAVIAGGACILAAPYLLHPLPDRFLNGRSILLGYSVVGIAISTVIWRIL